MPIRPGDEAGDGVWDAIQILWALRWTLHGRPDAVDALAEPERIEALGRALATWPAPMAALPIVPGRNDHVLAALIALGHVHELLLPLPDWEPPERRMIVREVQGRIASDRPRARRIPEADVIGQVDDFYLEVRRWPFEAILPGRVAADGEAG